MALATVGTASQAPPPPLAGMSDVRPTPLPLAGMTTVRWRADALAAEHRARRRRAVDLTIRLGVTCLQQYDRSAPGKRDRRACELRDLLEWKTPEL
jgi:hypothetical protein